MINTNAQNNIAAGHMSNLLTGQNKDGTLNAMQGLASESFYTMIGIMVLAAIGSFLLGRRFSPKGKESGGLVQKTEMRTKEQVIKNAR
jgi:hypothetical protein